METVSSEVVSIPNQLGRRTYQCDTSRAHPDSLGNVTDGSARRG